MSVGPKGDHIGGVFGGNKTRLTGAYFAYKRVLLYTVQGWPARVPWPPALGFILAVNHICPMHVSPVIALY